MLPTLLPRRPARNRPSRRVQRSRDDPHRATPWRLSGRRILLRPGLDNYKGSSLNSYHGGQSTPVTSSTAAPGMRRARRIAANLSRIAAVTARRERPRHSTGVANTADARSRAHALTRAAVRHATTPRRTVGGHKPRGPAGSARPAPGRARARRSPPTCRETRLASTRNAPGSRGGSTAPVPRADRRDPLPPSRTVSRPQDAAHGVSGNCW
jgi:hypothetical protein